MKALPTLRGAFMESMASKKMG